MKKILSLIFVIFAILLVIRPVFALTGDVNGDGKVDITDIALVGKHFGTTPSSHNWDARCDLNSDGKVDITDMSIVARAFGTHT